MFLATLKSIFDIDNVGNRWGVRVLYLLTMVLNAAVHFNPWADTDFTPLQSWAIEVYSLTEYDANQYEALMAGWGLKGQNCTSRSSGGWKSRSG